MSKLKTKFVQLIKFFLIGHIQCQTNVSQVLRYTVCAVGIEPYVFLHRRWLYKLESSPYFIFMHCRFYLRCLISAVLLLLVHKLPMMIFVTECESMFFYSNYHTSLSLSNISFINWAVYDFVFYLIREIILCVAEVYMLLLYHVF